MIAPKSPPGPTMTERLLAAARTLVDGAAPAPICAYLYDLGGLRQWVISRKLALPRQCRLFYAMKANSDDRLLGSLSGVVDGFEAASLGEVEKARATSPTMPVVFGGPGKTDDELAGAFARDVELVHAESVTELRRIDRVGREAGRRLPVLLRVNLAGPLPQATLKMAGSPTQFGIDEHELPAAIAAAARCDHLDVQGFHLHSLSNSLDHTRHLELIGLYLSKLRKWERVLGRPARVLNIGGGIGVDYACPDRLFNWPSFCRGLQDLLTRSGRSDLQLVLECGRYLVAEAGAYAAEVLDLKRNHGITFAIVRGGSHHFRLPSSWQHSHPFRILTTERWRQPFERPEVRDMRISVAGQLCTPKDLLARDVHVTGLRVGDVLVFTHAGAYGWSISHHDFLCHPHPAVQYLAEPA